MSEALKAVKDYFFDEVGVNRLESRHAFGNPHSGMGERYPVKQMRMTKAMSRLDFLKGKKDERSNIQQKER